MMDAFRSDRVDLHPRRATTVLGWLLAQRRDTAERRRKRQTAGTGVLTQAASTEAISPFLPPRAPPRG